MLTARLHMFVLHPPKPGLGHWPAFIVLFVAVVLYLFAGLSLISPVTEGRAYAGVNGQYPLQAGVAVPPLLVPDQYRDVSMEDAVAYNASIPVSTASNPAARPFMFSIFSASDRQMSLECLTAAIYYEAATESVDGQRAVAQVVLNRVRHPAFPGSICGVVFQGSERSTGCQFTFTCDGSLARVPYPALWARARAIARAALAGKVYAPVGWATHYHTNWVVPYWGSSLVKLANIGSHIFYRWPGGWGRASAFINRYGGNEPIFAKMRYIGIGGPIGEELTPEQKAELAAGGFAKRAIVRRFEPVKREDVAALFARQTPAGAKVDNGYRWALTGEGASDDAFGKKPAIPSPAPAPAAATSPTN